MTQTMTQTKTGVLAGRWGSTQVTQSKTLLLRIRAHTYSRSELKSVVSITMRLLPVPPESKPFYQPKRAMLTEALSESQHVNRRINGSRS